MVVESLMKACYWQRTHELTKAETVAPDISFRAFLFFQADIKLTITHHVLSKLCAS